MWLELYVNFEKGKGNKYNLDFKSGMCYHDFWKTHKWKHNSLKLMDMAELP